MKEHNIIWRVAAIACRKEIVAASLKVALVVGVLLNLINQWEAITAINIAGIHWPKLFMTFCVPYLVSTYASVATYLREAG